MFGDLRQQLRFVVVRSLIVLMLVCLSWGSEPAWAAKSRLFLDLDLSVLQTLKLPHQTPQGQGIRDWTGLAYDRQHNRFYSLATLSTRDSGANLYLAQLSLSSPSDHPSLSVEALTPLQEAGDSLRRDRWQPHSIALSPESSLFISGTRVRPISNSPSDLPSEQFQPFICEFSVDSGQQQTCLILPDRYQPQPETSPAALGALTLMSNGTGGTGSDPFPLFAATEYATEQDVNEAQPGSTVSVRWLQALLNSGDHPFWLAEYAYPVDALPGNGLEALLVLGQSGHFLSVESSHDKHLPNTRIYQVTVSDATDTSRVDRLDTLSLIKPLKKKLLLDLSTQLPDANGQICDLSDGPQLGERSKAILLMGHDQIWVLKLEILTPKRFANQP